MFRGRWMADHMAVWLPGIKANRREGFNSDKSMAGSAAACEWKAQSFFLPGGQPCLKPLCPSTSSTSLNSPSSNLQIPRYQEVPITTATVVHLLEPRGLHDAWDLPLQTSVWHMPHGSGLHPHPR